jgi:hypothetical protein
MDALKEKVEKINCVDYGSMFSYEAHSAVRDVLSDIERIIDAVPTIESQRRERAAVDLLRTVDWVGSGAKGRIEDAIGILSGMPGRDE